MWSLLREKSFLHALELSFNPLDLLTRCVALRRIEFCAQRAPVRAGQPHLDVAVVV